VLLKRLVADPGEAVLSRDGTVAFVDISGFTRLAERLARGGREGAEQLVDTINACFSTLLDEAYVNGASLLKFGGDALLLWFEGPEHALRACASAVAMRRTLRRIGRIELGATTIVLHMSVGIHSGRYEMFLVGGSHREHLIAGPAASVVVATEAAASSGQILVSPQTAKLLPARCLGAAGDAGILLARSPSVHEWIEPAAPVLPPEDMVAGCLSVALRAHLLAGPAVPEHRTATVSFLQFGQLDEFISRQGAAAAADAVDHLVRIAQEAADRYEICFLDSDIASGGGKILFTAGAPRVVGDDEERMLLALRRIVDARPRLPIRVGVNRGHVFAGEVGPPYRRTYVSMGDTTNLAARLCANAPWGEIYATERVLARSRARFCTTAVPPFTVKGKIRPVQAWAVGGAVRGVPAVTAGARLPLVGRDAEVGMLRQAIADARRRNGGLIELVGETGVGKSRLLAEARDLAQGMRVLHGTCETYTQAIPYIVWRDPLRQLLESSSDDPDAVVLDQLRAHVQRSPELRPWLPLLAIAVGVEAPTTREVEELSPRFRPPKLHEVVLSSLASALAVPSLVLIEHAHLMDEASAALLQALEGVLQTSSWVVIVTRRDVAEGFRADPSAAARVQLEPLTREATLTLAEAAPQAHTLPPHILEFAAERSAGSPEFLLELLSAAELGSDVLPDSVEAAASARIDALEPGDRALIRRAAVLGLRFRPSRLQHVLEPGSAQPGEQTWARLSGLFAIDSGGYIRFKSPIVCEAAHVGLPFALRRRLHAAVGQALELDLVRDVDAEPAVLSLHFSRAGDHDRAWKYALIGAERASARFANADAAHLYRRAIEAGRGAAKPGELAAAWEALGEALRQAGELSAAADAFTSARRLVVEDPIADARLCFRHGQIAARAGRLSGAVRWMRRGLRILEPVSNHEASTWRARLIAELAWIRQRQRRFGNAERLCREALTAAEEIGELRAQARASYTLDWALFELGRSAEATYSSRALEIYRELGDPELEAKVLNNLGGFAYWEGRWEEAVDLYGQAGACCERAGNPADVAFAECNRGEILSDQGLFDEAERLLRRAQRVWSSTGDRHRAAFASTLLGRLAVRVGRFEEGVRILETAAADMRQLGLDFYVDFARALVAEGEALGGDAQRGLAVADELLASGTRYALLLQRVRGIGLGRLGEREAALRELELAVTTARERGEDYELALALNALAALGPLDGGRAQERDAIFGRLGVIRPSSFHPRIAGQPRRDVGDQHDVEAVRA
jgi:class 3 adenylate cyclase/tetratricopeptide (TPR) repeat protein